MTPTQCSLLIVDDEPQVLKVLSDLLQKDFEIITAETGECAKELFARRDIDLILADQKLPGMAGVQLLEWVRPLAPSLRKVFLVHGEPQQSEVLAKLLRSTYGLDVAIPAAGEAFDLTGV